MTCVALTLVSCWPRSDEVYVFGGDSTAHLVIVFSATTTREEISEFYRNELSAQAGSLAFLPGVQAMIKTTTGDQTGVAVYFHATATADERASLESRIADSPIVDRVLENLSPLEASAELQK